MAGGQPPSADMFLYPDGGWGWVIMMGCFSCLLFTPGLTEAFGIFFLEFRRYFGADASEVSWIASIMMSMTFFASPVAAALTNRFGCRPVVFVGGLVSSLGLVLSSFATGIFYLYISFGVITGFSYGMVFIPSVVLVSYYFKERHALANGVSFSGSAVGNMIFPPLIHYFIENFGWRGALLMLGGMNLNLCVAAALYRPPPLKETPRKLMQEEEKAMLKGNGGEPKKKMMDFNIFKENYVFCLICVLLFLLGFSTFIPLIHLIPRAVYLGIPHGKASLLVSAIGLAGFIGRIAHGVIINLGLITPYRMFVLAVFVAGVSAMLTPFGNTYMLLMAYAVMYGLTTGCYNPLVAVLMKEAVGDEKLPTAVGFSLLVLGLGHLVGAPVAGLLYDISGAYNLSFYMAGMVFLITVLLSFTRPYLERKQAARDARHRLRELEDVKRNGNEIRMKQEDKWSEGDSNESNV